MAILYSAAAGSTGNTVYLLASNETTGAPVTTLVWNTASFTINYVLTRALAVPITLADLAAADSAFAEGGFKLVLGNLYRLDVPNAAFASSGRIIILPQLAGVFFSPVQAIAPAFDPLAAGDTAATIADAVLDEALAGHVAAGSAGKALGDILDANQLKFSYAPGTGILTVFKADGVTPLFTRTLTLAARDAIQVSA